MSMHPRVSLVIPTHDRARYLARCLAAISLQEFPAERLEVLVVADACTDETSGLLQEEQARSRFTIRWWEAELRSAAAARNLGAEMARGNLLLFVDDDVELLSGSVAAHVRTHETVSDAVGIGPYVPFPVGEADFLALHIRDWWVCLFAAMAEPEHRFDFRDLVSGNLSIGRQLFRQLGGFDATIASCGREDYEFGLRLLDAGFRFRAVPEALGYHHDTTDLDRFLRRKVHEGAADVQIGRKHPEIRAALPIARDPRGFRRFVRTIAFRAPELGDRIAQRARRRLDSLERRGLHSRWNALFRRTASYWYWRGVAAELTTVRGLNHFIQEAGSGSRSEMITDLTPGRVQ